MAGKSITLKSLRASAGERPPPRPALRVIAIFALLQALVLLMALLAFPGAAGAADAIKGEVSVTTGGGFARLVFRFVEEPEPDVRLANGIVVISFKKPVDVSVDRISTAAADYVGAARRDPDGMALRMALARKVTVNSMIAGEQLFVDLLPDTWIGLPPGLPQEVVEELARRAREAEKKFRAQQLLAKQKQVPPLRLRVGTQPTFTRYVFELPELVAVTTDRGKDGLTLVFDAPWRFDLADAQATLPSAVASITARPTDDAVTVRFEFTSKVDVRTFREDNNFVVDLSSAGPKDQGGPAAVKPGELPVVAAVPEARPPPPAPAPDPPTSVPPSPRAAASPVAPPPVAPQTMPVTAPVPLPAPRPASAPPAKHARERGAAPAAPTVAPPAPKPETVAPSDPPPGVPKVADAPPKIPQPAAEPADEPSTPAAGVIASKQASDAVAELGKPPPRVATRTRIPHRVPPSAAEPVAPVTAAPSAAPGPPAAPAVPSVAASPTTPSDAAAQVVVEVRQQSDGLRLVFPFAQPAAAAVFRRADTLWLVFDAAAPIDVSRLIMQPIAAVRSVVVARSREGQIVRIKLDRPKLTSLSADGSTWTVTIGDMVLGPTQPLAVSRALITPGHASAVIALEGAQQVHRLSDPDVGDTLLAVTAFGPARGFLKSQNFVEFRALASTHGVVVQPLADDLTVDVVPDKIVIGRPVGLVLSSSSFRTGVTGQVSEVSDAAGRRGTYRAFAFDAQLWGFDQQADFRDRQRDLIAVAAAAPEGKRVEPRLDLARFYLARSMFVEAKAVLDVALADAADDPSALVLRGVADIMLGRGTAALKDLTNPAVGNQQDAALWRAIAYAQLGKWSEAREGFQGLAAATAMLPIELQRFAFKEALRVAVEVGDFADAANQLHEFETVGVPPELEPTLAVLKGRVSEGLGRIGEALMAYQAAARSSDPRAAAQGQLRDIVLRSALGELKRADAIPLLEILTTLWRGDQTEAEALQLLGRLYTEESRFRDAFGVMRTALAVHPGSDMTRRIQEEAAASFDTLFLSGKADAMPVIDALSLFYDYRQLTPIGRRGDEMIRRLADRLVSVDLLDQAAELLQHQVDHRLQGAARAQVAIRLAVIYLMGHKPDRAIQVLRATRSGDLPNELRNQRLLLEARALSETGRHDLAIEVIANLQGKEAERLRADVLWAARRWREAAEQIEKIHGQRYREFAPLTEQERADILRAAIAYALADDALGLERFRQKYAAKMAEGPDRRSFDVVTAPLGVAAAEFGEVAKAVSAIDTLDGFLRDIRARFPEAGVPPAAPPPAAPPPQTSTPTAPKPS